MEAMEDEMSGACSMNRRMNAYRILVGMPGGKRPLGKHRCNWIDEIEKDLKYDGVGVNMIDLSYECCNKPWSIKCREVLEFLCNWFLLNKDSTPWKYLVTWIAGWLWFS
jgi:hypothetical protein